MENDARDFLLRVVKTLIAALLWMVVNVFVGIYMGWMFFFTIPTTGNYIFYAWMLGSLVLMLYYFRSVWRRPFASDENQDQQSPH
jgi:hypothetical protein